MRKKKDEDKEKGGGRLVGRREKMRKKKEEDKEKGGGR